MRTLTDLITEYQDVTNDTSAANKTRGIRKFNEKQRQICADSDFWWLRDEWTIPTLANTNSYQLPVRLRKLASVRVAIDSTEYTLDYIADPKKWDEFTNYLTAFRSDIPLYYTEREGKVLIYPTPTSAGNTIKLTGLKRPKDLVLENYTTGTIAVTNGSTAVVGTSTAWVVGNVKAGAYLIIDTVPYEIATVTDATNIVLVKKYEGVTATGLSYIAADVPTVYEDFQDILWISAAKDYFLKKQDAKMITAMTNEYEIIFKRLRDSTQSPSTDKVWNKKHNLGWNWIRYPWEITP